MASPETPDRGYMGDPRRGASIGRPNTSGFFNKAGEWVELTVTPGARPMSLRKVRLNGDYDQGGAYWGCNSPGSILYYYSDHTGSIDGYLHAANRADAKVKVRMSHPAARFYR